MSSNSDDSGGLVQRNAQPAAPSEQLPPTGRDPLGRFAPGPGNRWAMKTGARSRYVAAGLMPEQAEARAVLAARQAAIETDLGGHDELSALAHDMVTDYLRLRLIADWLAENLMREGPLTGKGRQRAALTAFLQVVDRLHRVTSSLGLGRRARPVPTPTDWIEGKA